MLRVGVAVAGNAGLCRASMTRGGGFRPRRLRAGLSYQSGMETVDCLARHNERLGC
jgi:hypothetical protein